MRPLIKICGITNLIDAKISLNNGADHIGLINIKESPRFVTEIQITEIINELNNQEKSKVVLLTDLSNDDEIIRLASSSNIKILQLYSKNIKRESLMKIRSLGFKVFLPFLIESKDDLEEINIYKGFADLFILDNKPRLRGQLGGSGELLDWAIFKFISEALDAPLGLAGGLNPDNIIEAIRYCKPYLVDASSGLESKPAYKSLSKIKGFVEAVYRASQEDLVV
jgi:phosphoribosylanthranilate isomerase